MAQKFFVDVRFKENVDIEKKLTLSGETASRAAEINGSGELVSSSVTSAELAHLSGVTSAIQTQLDAKVDESREGVANGIATLDSSGKLPSSQLPTSATEYKGAWDASTNSPSLADGVGTNGDLYRVSAGGSVDFDGGGARGSITFAAGDAVIYNGSIWEKIPGEDLIQSVFGRTGVITAQAGDYTASQVTNVPAGNIAATTVQAAIDELDSEKQADVVTTQGDLVLGDVSGDASRLPIGANNTFLGSDGTTASWQTLPAGSDENVKISANDTTAGYLEDKIVASEGVNSINIIEVSTLNDGANEDLQIQIDESKINHDNLEGFVANEHIDHSSVSVTTAADSGLSGGGDITASRSLSVDINGTTAETSVAQDDEVLIHDSSAGALRKMTRANFVGSSAGDLAEASFSGAQSASNAAITGLAFANGTVRSFSVHLSILIDATADLYEVFDLQGIQKASGWEMSVVSTGDDTNVTFSISAAGQIQYSSLTYAGFVSMTMRYRATTTSV